MAQIDNLPQKLPDLATPHLDLRVLRQFLVVAETLNMTTGARKMGMTTAAVSQMVIRLEREVGAALFERGPRGLRVTPAGALLRKRAQRLTECESQTLHELAAYHEQLLPTLRIQMAETIAVYLMNSIVAELTPQVGKLEAQMARTTAVMQAFLSEETDIIVLSDALTEIPHLERHRLCTQGLVALVPASVPKSKLDIRQIADSLPLVRFKRGGILDKAVEEYLAAHQLSPGRPIECDSSAVMSQIVDGGQGWAIAPPLSMAWLQPRLKAVNWMALPGPIPESEIFLISEKGRFLDLPESLAKGCRTALRRELATWRGTPLEPCFAALRIDRDG
jgi:DNA-binding transcriptional LysR family regulator